MFLWFIVCEKHFEGTVGGPPFYKMAWWPISSQICIFESSWEKWVLVFSFMINWLRRINWISFHFLLFVRNFQRKFACKLGMFFISLFFLIFIEFRRSESHFVCTFKKKKNIFEMPLESHANCNQSHLLSHRCFGWGTCSASKQPFPLIWPI